MRSLPGPDTSVTAVTPRMIEGDRMTKRSFNSRAFDRCTAEWLEAIRLGVSTCEDLARHLILLASKIVEGAAMSSGDVTSNILGHTPDISHLYQEYGHTAPTENSFSLHCCTRRSLPGILYIILFSNQWDTQLAVIQKQMTR